jgi:hypothetical protein
VDALTKARHSPTTVDWNKPWCGRRCAMLSELVALLRLWIILSVAVLGSAQGAVPFIIWGEGGQRGLLVAAGETCNLIGSEIGAGIPVRGESFDAMDHELAHGGGYGLVRAPRVIRSVDFDVLDHELAYAGGYGLRPLPGIVSGEAFDAVDHELAHAEGYALRPLTQVVADAHFDFIDHELAHAGTYVLCAGPLAAG